MPSRSGLHARAVAAIDQHRHALGELSQRIHATPELGYQERQASAWIAAFLAAGAGLRGRAADVWGFFAIAAGGIGCVAGGKLADRFGRERFTIWSMTISGACAAIVGIVAPAPQVAVAVAIVWGLAVVADSAQFSALVTELAPPHAVGTALTLQTSLGFLLTMVSIQLVPQLAGALGWRWAFVVLAGGPALGILAMDRLRRLRGL